jgi:hypothetical protein
VRRLCRFVRPRLLPSIFLLMLPLLPLQAGSIQYHLTGLGGNTYRYDYVFSGFALQAFQEVEFLFSPTLYGDLSNPVAGSGFSRALAQPGNPSGAWGFYSILALVENPSLAATFSVDFTYLGSGDPGTQLYAINQFNPDRVFQYAIDSGATATTAATPEPSGWLLTAGGLAAGLLPAIRRRRRT